MLINMKLQNYYGMVYLALLSDMSGRFSLQSRRPEPFLFFTGYIRFHHYETWISRRHFEFKQNLHFLF